MRLLVLALFAGVALGQTAKVSGVVRDFSGQALAGVVLTLSLDPRAAMAEVSALPKSLSVASAASDQRGEFRFESIAPGRYRLTAARQGFADAPPQVLVVGAPDLTGISVTLGYPGVLTGRVTSADGEPCAGIVMRVLERVFVDGRRRYRFRGSDSTTDSQGEYRIQDLVPGRYWLYAQAPAPGLFGGRRADSLRSAYYPGSPDIAGALPIAVSGGSETRVDMRLRVEPVRVLSGFVFGVTGGPAALANVVLLNSDQIPLAAPERRVADFPRPVSPVLGLTRTDAEGRFRIEGVPAGTHRLVALGGAGFELGSINGRFTMSTRPSGTPDDGAAGDVTVSVAQEDVEGLRIVLRPLAEITGRVRIGDQDWAAYQRESLARGAAGEEFIRMVGERIPPVELSPADGVSSGARFRGYAGEAVKVPAGQYWVEIPSLPAHLYVQSVRFGGLDVTGRLVDVASYPAELDIALGSDTGRVSARVVDGNGNPLLGAAVSLWPRVEDWSKPAGGALTVRSAQDGSVAFAGVPPGEYLVAAFEHVPEEGIELYAPFLRSFSGQAQRITVAPHGEASSTLPVISRVSAERVAAELPR